MHGCCKTILAWGYRQVLSGFQVLAEQLQAALVGAAAVLQHGKVSPAHCGSKPLCYYHWLLLQQNIIPWAIVCRHSTALRPSLPSPRRAALTHVLLWLLLPRCAP
jgi:hypothetical protein